MCRARERLTRCSLPARTGNAAERVTKSPLEELIVTNSIVLNEASKNCKKIKQLDIAPMLAEAIRRTHNGESISVLFNS